MQQVMIIHGGTSFASYEEYFFYLRLEEVSLERLRRTGWKRSLNDRLGPGYEVFNPLMPNSGNAKYIEWKIWFDKLLPLFDDNVILIGHSLGGVFLAKYLSEETVSKRIRATILIAPPFDEDEGRVLPEFAITHSLEKLQQQGGEIIFYHSKDDPVVSFSELKKYENLLPGVRVRVFEDRQHFNQDDLPELVEEIRNLQ